MLLVFSEHWKIKRKYRRTISDKLLEIAISKGKVESDKSWKDVKNAIIQAPDSGRTLKVIYKRLGPETYKIITAYWLD